jgi:hypothetical protein
MTFFYSFKLFKLIFKPFIMYNAVLGQGKIHLVGS